MSVQAPNRPLSGDPYPSRCEAVPRFLERRDPVVWGDKHAAAAKGPLSLEQLEFFEENGYLYLEGILSPEEVQAYRDEIVELGRRPDLQTREEIIREPDSDTVRSAFMVHKLSRKIRDLAKDDRFAGAARQIVGSGVYIHQSRVNYKPGFRGKDFYWHSDFETWHMEDGLPRMRTVSCSITLTDNYAYNGALMVLPGSHKTYLTCVGETPANHYKRSLRNQEIGVPDNQGLKKMVDKHGIAMPTGRAGSALFFDCNIMHGSNGNITPYPRSNVFFVFNSLENKPVEPFCGLPPRPEHIGSRDYTEI